MCSVLLQTVAGCSCGSLLLLLSVIASHVSFTRALVACLFSAAAAAFSSDACDDEIQSNIAGDYITLRLLRLGCRWRDARAAGVYGGM